MSSDRNTDIRKLGTLTTWLTLRSTATLQMWKPQVADALRPRLAGMDRDPYANGRGSSQSPCRRFRSPLREVRVTGGEQAADGRSAGEQMGAGRQLLATLNHWSTHVDPGAPPEEDRQGCRRLSSATRVRPWEGGFRTDPD